MAEELKLIDKIAKFAYYTAKKTAINTVCDIMPTNYNTVMFAAAVELREQPLAQKMLNYYISGASKDVEVSIEDLLLEDNAIKIYLLTEIAKQINSDAKNGVVPIKQARYSNMNWKNALGSINMNWKIENNKLKIWFHNRYRWHPTAERVTQCVHKAADNLKAEMGAAEFDMIGKEYVFPQDIVLKQKINILP